MQGKFLIGLLLGLSVHGQGTLQLDFEGLPLGATPVYVQQAASSAFVPVVASSSTWPPFQPYDGGKFLVARGEIFLTSPDSNPIIGFLLRYAALDEGQRVLFRANGVIQSAMQLETWNTLAGTLNAPASELSIEALRYDVEFRNDQRPATFAIDGIELITIPEPSMYLLLALGVGSLMLFRKR